MHHAMRETRTVHEREAPLLPWWEATLDGNCVSLMWARPALISAEAVLSAFLAPSDLTLLSTAPDNVYSMVGFAATWIFVSNFIVYQLSGGKMGGSSELLQAMTIERLNQIAHSPDHSAARCGHVLGALFTAWERRKPSANDTEIIFAPDACERPAPAYEQDIPNPGPPEYQSESHPDALPGNSDLFMDDAFWTMFIENLNSDAFKVAQGHDQLNQFLSGSW
jgi:hypothetical protein